MPEFDTPTNTEYLKIGTPGAKRLYLHEKKLEDYKLLDVANFNQNYTPVTYPEGKDSQAPGNKPILRAGAYCVANRTLLNYELYTTEDPPKNIYINVPYIVRPNGKNDNVYAEFKMKYDATVTCWYDQYEHPQVIQTGNIAAAKTISVSDDHGYGFEKYDITLPMRHLHGNKVKQCLHGRTTDMSDTIWATKNHCGRYGNA